MFVNYAYVKLRENIRTRTKSGALTEKSLGLKMRSTFVEGNWNTGSLLCDRLLAVPKHDSKN